MEWKSARLCSGECTMGASYSGHWSSFFLFCEQFFCFVSSCLREKSSSAQNTQKIALSALLIAEKLLTKFNKLHEFLQKLLFLSGNSVLKQPKNIAPFDQFELHKKRETA